MSTALWVDAAAFPWEDAPTTEESERRTAVRYDSVWHTNQTSSIAMSSWGATREHRRPRRHRQRDEYGVPACVRERDVRKMLARILAEMRTEDMEAVLLLYLPEVSDGWGMKDVARMMEISYERVRQRVTRAYRDVRVAASRVGIEDPR